MSASMSVQNVPETRKETAAQNIDLGLSSGPKDPEQTLRDASYRIALENNSTFNPPPSEILNSLEQPITDGTEHVSTKISIGLGVNEAASQGGAQTHNETYSRLTAKGVDTADALAAAAKAEASFKHSARGQGSSTETSRQMQEDLKEDQQLAEAEEQALGQEQDQDQKIGDQLASSIKEGKELEIDQSIAEADIVTLAERQDLKEELSQAHGINQALGQETGLEHAQENSLSQGVSERVALEVQASMQKYLDEQWADIMQNPDLNLEVPTVLEHDREQNHEQYAEAATQEELDKTPAAKTKRDEEFWQNLEIRLT